MTLLRNSSGGKCSKSSRFCVGSINIIFGMITKTRTLLIIESSNISSISFRGEAEKAQVSFPLQY